MSRQRMTMMMSEHNPSKPHQVGINAILINDANVTMTRGQWAFKSLLTASALYLLLFCW